MNFARRLTVLAIAFMLPAGGVALGFNVVMLTDGNGSLTAVESTLRSRLQLAGFTVNTLWDGDTQTNYTAAFANNDVVYIPSDVSVSDIGTKLRTCPIGVVNE